MTTFVRTQRGKVVHRNGCVVLGRPLVVRVDGKFVQKPEGIWRSDWVWAEDKPVEQIRQIVEQLGYHCCKHCKPLGK